MIESISSFDDEHFDAMQAAADFAEMIECETGGLQNFGGDPREFEIDDDVTASATMFLYPPDDPEAMPFGRIWDDLMPESDNDPYRSLDLINVGNVTIDTGDGAYDQFHSYRITGTESLLDGLGRFLAQRNLKWYERHAAWVFPALDIRAHLRARK